MNNQSSEVTQSAKSPTKSHADFRKTQVYLSYFIHKNEGVEISVFTCIQPKQNSGQLPHQLRASQQRQLEKAIAKPTKLSPSQAE